ALGKLRDRDSLDLLIAAFRDPRTEGPVRDASLEAVEAIGTEKAVKALGELVAQMTLPVDQQARAIAALGRFEDHAAIPPLLGTLKAPQPGGRAAGIDALVAIVEARRSAEGRGRRRRPGRRERAAAPTAVPADVSRAARSLLADPDVSVRHR